MSCPFTFLSAVIDVQYVTVLARRKNPISSIVACREAPSYTLLNLLWQCWYIL